MAIVDMLMPKLGESVMEGTVIQWLKKEGDAIEQDEAVLEVATDKVDTEVPALQDGIIKEILVKDGDVVEVGKPLARIEVKSEESDAGNIAPTHPTESHKPKETETAAADKDNTAPRSAQILTGGMEAVSGLYTSRPASGRFYSPLVLNIARQEGVSMDELEKIKGSGKENRVTKKDILNYLEQRKNQPAAETMQQNVHEAVSEANDQRKTSTDTQKSGQETAKTVKQADSHATEDKNDVSTNVLSGYEGNYEISEMDRMRKIISERMINSKKTSAHVTSFVEADVTNIVQWRNKIKNIFKEQEGEALTYTPIFIEAIIKALKEFPRVNASVDGDKIILKKDINIGVAIALKNHNLIVPVIRNADQLNLAGITRKMNEYVHKARSNSLTSDDLSGGTYTVSNVGSFGNIMGTPVINQPQVAIMAFGSIQKKPAVIETPQGDTIGIRHKMFLSHTYDHRIIDGAMGGSFVRRVADHLESFSVDRAI